LGLYSERYLDIGARDRNELGEYVGTLRTIGGFPISQP
jgi:hypothetical protein